MTKKNWISIAALIAVVIVVLVIVVAVTRGEDAPAPSSTPAQADQPGSAQPASPPAPGAVETDLSGRQVIIPTNQSGDILSTSTDDGGTCEDIRSPRGLQIQRINQYPILFSPTPDRLGFKDRYPPDTQTAHEVRSWPAPTTCGS